MFSNQYYCVPFLVLALFLFDKIATSRSQEAAAKTPAGEELCVFKRPYYPDFHKPVYRVGVLAIRGPEAAYNEFNKTFSDYLTATAGQRFEPPVRFEMVPLNFKSSFELVEQRRVDFIYLNPSLYSCIESEYKAQSLVSQISRRKIGANVYNLNQFGGVIAARHDDDDIRTIYDLRDKIIAAASISGLGSGQMQFKQMIEAGMSYINDPKQIVFTSNQNLVVQGVLNGEFDVAFVRTDQIERTKDEDGNPIDASLLKVIDPKPNLTIAGDPFPFRSSTDLYPEWNIAALDHVPADVSVELQDAMLAVADHGRVFSKIRSCRDTFDGRSDQYCNTLAFIRKSNNIFNQSVRCDTSVEIAELASEAMKAGKYSEWRTTMSYMQLRSMQESTGFISFNEELNKWRCVRIVDLYDAVTCPEGFLKRSKEEVDHGCDEAGLVCKEGYKCICKPCVRPLVCEGSTLRLSFRHDVCVSFGVLFAAIIVPVCAVIAVLVHYYVRYKRRQADCVWRVEPHELKFDDPPQIIGRGTFGLVVLAEYHGTNVAVKRVIPPRSSSNNNNNNSANKKSQWPLHDFLLTNQTNTTIEDDNGNGSTENKEWTARNRNRGAGDDDNSMELGMTHNNNNNIYHHDEDGEEKTDVSSNYAVSDDISDDEDSEYGGVMILDKFLRAGSMASVYVMKTIRPGEYTRLKADFVREMRHLSKLRHPCITTVMGAVTSKKDDPMLVMEYMNHGSLYDLLHNDSMVVEGEFVLPILRDIAQGMRFLHSSNPQVIHGDLKAQNILVDAKFRAKVADFGLSQKRRVGVSGTTYWMAPELLRGESLNTSESDMFSLGVVLYELYSRKDPYEGEKHDDVLRGVCHPKVNKRPPVPEACPPDVAQLMKDCLDGDPAARPTAAEVDLNLKLLDVSNVEPRQLSLSSSSRPQTQSRFQQQQQQGEQRQRTEMLYQVFPQPIADALAAGRKVEPESHDMVTVFFADIVGFTNIAGSLPPLKVSDLLDRLYSALDGLATSHGIFKIETAGDAYMAVSNLVDKEKHRANDHAKRMAEFALGVIKASSHTLIDPEDPTRGCIQLRIGIHSGPVVSNVVGSINPKFGIFGDTVNTAARMESSSLAGKIQCSKRTAMLLIDQAPGPTMTVVLRGDIPIKSKGDMTTYWIGRAAGVVVATKTTTTTTTTVATTTQFRGDDGGSASSSSSSSQEEEGTPTFSNHKKPTHHHHKQTKRFRKEEEENPQRHATTRRKSQLDTTGVEGTYESCVEWRSRWQKQG